MDEKPRDKQSELFMGLMVSFQVGALQYMGKLINPMTGQTERNLEGAASAIDMLDMLAAKTRGNLTAEESKMLEETLSHLKLNYVAEASKPSPQSAEPPPVPPTPETQTQGPSE